MEEIVKTIFPVAVLFAGAVTAFAVTLGVVAYTVLAVAWICYAELALQ